MTPDEPRREVLEAVDVALQIHDGMREWIDRGMPREAVEPARGFLAALRSQGFDIDDVGASELEEAAAGRGLIIGGVLGILAMLAGAGLALVAAGWAP